VKNWAAVCVCAIAYLHVWCYAVRSYPAEFGSAVCQMVMSRRAREKAVLNAGVSAGLDDAGLLANLDQFFLAPVDDFWEDVLILDYGCCYRCVCSWVHAASIGLLYFRCVSGSHHLYKLLCTRLI
jgi:hypothetical protein